MNDVEIIVEKIPDEFAVKYDSGYDYYSVEVVNDDFYAEYMFQIDPSNGNIINHQKLFGSSEANDEMIASIELKVRQYWQYN